MSSSFVTNSNHLIDLNSGANTLSITGAVVITGNLSVTGNSTFSGNILGNKIQNGTSNVNIATANGNVTITANAGNTWTFATGGNLVFPSNLIIDNESPNTRIYMSSGSLKIRAATTASLKLGWDEFTGASASGSLAHVIANGGGSEQPANLVVLTGNTSTTTYQWVFGAGGDLTAPGNLSAVGNITGNNLSATNLVINSITSDDSSFVTIDDGVNVNGEILATGNITGGNVLTGGAVKTGSFVTGNIPTAAGVGAGARAFVTDANSGTFGNLYVGGAANAMPVWSNGTSWYVG
jgi:hypothetical protein